ncbi:Fis family transcriptional regulator, partial [bacterium]|nr:Fis family transcriptional regulator [bacterium]
LKDRRIDIPYLIDHFIRLFNARKGKNLIGVTPGVMSVLMRLDFPGNIRELENIIEYGYAVCHGRTLEVEHLPAELQTLASSTELSMRESDAIPLGKPDLTEAVIIRQTLKQFGGNRTKTACKLSMDRTTLWRKMRKFGIK